MEIKFQHFDFVNDIEKQRILFKRSFPETLGTPVPEMSHYNWKFKSFPYGSTFEYVAYINDDIVGYYAAIPYQYRVKDKITSVGMVCDVMTSPDYRGQGVFTQIGHYATSELATIKIPFTTGYPIRKAVIPGHLKVGWKVAFELPIYMKFLKSDAFLKQRKLGVFKYIVNPCLAFYNGIVKNSSSPLFTYNIYDNILSVNGYEVFEKKWEKQQAIALCKDIEFCKWRYSAPERKYAFLGIYRHNELVAVVTFREIEKEGVPALGILDYMLLKEFDDCIGLVNKVLIKEAKKRHKEAIMIMLSKVSARDKKILSNGFIRSPFKFSFIIKNLTHEFNDSLLYNERSWDVMWVDSDDL